MSQPGQANNSIRPFQFSIAAMFFAVTFIAILCGVEAAKENTRKKRVAAIAEIRAAGGLVVCEHYYSWTGNRSQRLLRPPTSLGDPPRPGVVDVPEGQHVPLIAYDREISAADWEAVALFPEACIYGIPGASDVIYDE